MARQFFVGGNFKMNPNTHQQSLALVKTLNDAELDPATEVVIAPPSLYLLSLKTELRKDVQLSAQNAYFKPSGAFTGEISPAQLVDAQIPYVILGHSERRTLFHETSELVAQKTRAALDAPLKVILCIGETLNEREDAFVSNIVIAYEPVWAIGTGKVATSAQAQEAHADIRSYLSKAVSSNIASSTRIIYGGSVTAANCKELSTQPDVDGFLVGGASLKPEFIHIINAKKHYPLKLDIRSLSLIIGIAQLLSTMPRRSSRLANSVSKAPNMESLGPTVVGDECDSTVDHGDDNEEILKPKRKRQKKSKKAGFHRQFRV
ncbi:hypothetical protein C0992_002245 [Termitomyces sp. T32_za158]|nr:hypothetical protein C0992_002245 [Termitomyces sp. T32_za158]